MYTVYKHTNKLNGKVYIGITKQAVARRWQNGHGYDRAHFGNAIKKYGWDSFEHEIMFSGLTKQAACEMEQFLIIKYKSNENNFGYNILEGGQTSDGLSAKFGADNPRAISVKRIDPKTKETITYSTIKAAANEMGINHRGISKCCKGIVKTYKGYEWEYVGREVQKPFHSGIGNYQHEKQMKQVKLIEKDGSVLVFDSVKSAAQYVGVTCASISRYLSGIRKDKTGRRWSFAR